MSAVKKLIILSWLYFIQGIPYGIQDKFIPLHLRLHGFNFSKVSLMKSLLLPWLCKGIWAPFTQIYFSQKHWLIASTFGLSFISFIGSYVAPQNITGIAIILFLMNVLCALQDIIVDGFAISSLNDTLLGIGNSLQVVLYKFGSLLGGAGLIYVTSLTSWSCTYVSLSFIYLLSTILIIYLPEMTTQSRKLSTDKIIEVNLPCDRNQMDPYNEKMMVNEHTETSKKAIYNQNKAAFIISNILRDVFQNKKMLWLCIYISFYKMGERGAINNFPLFLLDKNISPQSLAFWNGVVSQIVSILGSIFGGIILTSNERNKTIKVLMSFSIHRFVSIFLCFFIVKYCSMQSNSEMFNALSYILSIVALLYLNFTSGVISTATFTLMMEASRTLHKESQTTHYSVLASVEIAGKLIFASLAGIFIDSYGMDNSFLFFTMLSLVPYFILKKDVM